MLEVLFVFLRLGCTSFGGPIAHLGYFERELVQRRQWCTPAEFAEIVALAQTVPGPASSQTGFVLGLLRAGWPGAAAAWFGFTLPSALLMLVFAYTGARLHGPAYTSVLHGLQLVAVAVVAQAVMSMQRSLAPDVPRLAIALGGAVVVLIAPAHRATLLAVALGALAGLVVLRKNSAASQTAGRLPSLVNVRVAYLSAVLFFILLLLCLVGGRAAAPSAAQIFASFYRTGALVFGGGHVVLPMLQETVVAPGWVTPQDFLAGYGSAQALPGPLFSFATYLGAMIRPSHRPLLNGVVALAGIFLPGLLIMIAALPFWTALRHQPKAQAALRGIKASVVGVLLAALYRPLWTNTIHSLADFTVALLLFVLLVFAEVQPWILVAGTAATFLLIALV